MWADNFPLILSPLAPDKSYLNFHPTEASSDLWGRMTLQLQGETTVPWSWFSSGHGPSFWSPENGSIMDFCKEGPIVKVRGYLEGAFWTDLGKVHLSIAGQTKVYGNPTQRDPGDPKYLTFSSRFTLNPRGIRFLFPQHWFTPLVS